MPGFCPPNNWPWLRWTRLASSVSRSLTRAPTPTSLSISTRDPKAMRIVAVEVVGRPVVDGEPEPGADVEALAELPRQAGGGIAGIALAVERAEDLWPQPADAENRSAAIAELEVGPAFARAAEAERGADGVRVNAAEHFLGMGRVGRGENDGRSPCGEGKLVH